MGVSSSSTGRAVAAQAKTLADFEAADIDGKLVKLEKYVGKVVLVVNDFDTKANIVIARDMAAPAELEAVSKTVAPG